MSPRTISPAAERVLTAAMHLFATQGYDRTSVGEIQELAGLTFGSGALYKHFATKEAALTEGIERFVDAASAAPPEPSPPNGDIATALYAVAAAWGASFDEHGEAWRIALRDLEAFPSLAERVRTERLRAPFVQFARWVEDQVDAGAAVVDDPVAFSAVALSALLCFEMLGLLLDDKPGGVSEDRFLTAWVAVFGDALTWES